MAVMSCNKKQLQHRLHMKTEATNMSDWLRHTERAITKLHINIERACIYTYTLYTELHTYTHKEELKTVLRELLACAQPNRHETFTEIWNNYRRVSSRGRRAKIRYSLGARDEYPEMTVRHFGFTEKAYGLPCTVRTL